MKCSTCGRTVSSASSSRSRVAFSSRVMPIRPRLVSGASAWSSRASSSPMLKGARPPGAANAISTRSGGAMLSVGVGSSTSSQRTTGFIRSENRKSSFSGLYRNSQGRRPSSGVSVVSMTKRRPLPCCGSMARRLFSMPGRRVGPNRALYSRVPASRACAAVGRPLWASAPGGRRRVSPTGAPRIASSIAGASIAQSPLNPSAAGGLLMSTV